MAGNSSRRGAIRKTAKGNPTAGSGGRRRQGLEGRGPTPKAAEREGHKAYKAKKKAESGRTPRRGGVARGSDSEWVAGRNSVVEALRARMPATALYVAEGTDRDGRLREAFRLAAEQGVSLLEVPRHELDKVTDGAVHQGIAVRVPPYEYAHPDDLLAAAATSGEPPLLVALDGVTDPRNLGAVVRSAAAFGAHGVVIPERRSAGMTASAWKTSAGAAARVPVARATNLVRWLTGAQKAGATVIGLAMGGGIELPELDRDLATGPVVIVVGSEGKGLGHLVSQTCDHLVAIPMDSATESLNAGVAAGIALYAVATARR